MSGTAGTDLDRSLHITTATAWFLPRVSGMATYLTYVKEYSIRRESKAGLISQSFQLLVQVMSASLGCCHKSCARSCVRVDQCVSVVGAVEVPLFECLRSSCNHVSHVGGP
jgi:hypothetical protein